MQTWSSELAQSKQIKKNKETQHLLSVLATLGAKASYRETHGHFFPFGGDFWEEVPRSQAVALHLDFSAARIPIPEPGVLSCPSFFMLMDI